MRLLGGQIIVCVFLLSLPAEAQNVITTLVGTEWLFPSGSVPALRAPLGRIQSIAVDGNGNVFCGDCDNHVIFKVDTAGTLVIVAGNGIRGASPNGPAIGVRLDCPLGLAFDRAGDLLFVDSQSGEDFQLIRKLTRDGQITTIVGGGNLSLDGVPALQARIRPHALVVDTAGNLYFSEPLSNRIWRVGSDGFVRNFAGLGRAGFSGDGGPASNAELSGPGNLSAAPDGTVLFCDVLNDRIRAILPNGIIRTIAGGGSSVPIEGGSATGAFIYRPLAARVEASGSVVFVASDGVIRRLSLGGAITTVAGRNTRNNNMGAFSGDGGPAKDAEFRRPQDIVPGPLGTVFVADTGNARIRKIDASGRINTFAGNGGWRLSDDSSNPLTVRG